MFCSLTRRYRSPQWRTLICIPFLLGGAVMSMAKLPPPPKYYAPIPMHIVQFGLPELQINNPWLLTDLDNILLSGKKLNVQGYKYVHLYLVEENDSIIFHIGVSHQPGEAGMGYFRYRQYTFFVSGCNPDSLFSRLPYQRIFARETYVDPELAPPPPPGGGTPYWRLAYAVNKFIACPYPRLSVIEKGILE